MTEPQPAANREGTTLRRLFIMAAGITMGIVLCVVAAAATFFWHISRPSPPKPWNNSAIQATFDGVTTEGDDNTFLFMYILENRSDEDYRLENGSSAELMTKLEKQKSLSNDLAPYLSIDYPIFVPAKHRTRVQIHLRVTYRENLPPNATDEQREAFNKQLKEYLSNKGSNLGGFVLFDTASRYQIDFPKGW